MKECTKKENKFLHGSKKIMNGKLTGKTDTDYFYFKCPTCGEIMQIKDVLTNKHKSGAIKVHFKLFCRECRLTDFVKISNQGWQGGKIDNI